MPSIPLHPHSNTQTSTPLHPLPGILQTPSGLALLEIQGQINAPPSTTTIGKIVFPHYDSGKSGEEWMKRVHFYVGENQRMTGEVRKLGKAVAVVRKREVGGAGEEGEELEIAEIVRWKIVFNHRPEPVGGERG